MTGVIDRVTDSIDRGLRPLDRVMNRIREPILEPGLVGANLSVGSLFLYSVATQPQSTALLAIGVFTGVTMVLSGLLLLAEENSSTAVGGDQNRQND